MRPIEDTEAPMHGSGDRQASEFLGALLRIVAHDLGRSLRIVQHAHDWLGCRTGNECERSSVARSVRAIGELTDQLDTLVSALRLYEHTRTMAMTEVSLSPLLARLSHDKSNAATSKGIRLAICPSSHRVVSNSALLRSIFGGFLSNAIKHSRPGGRILLGCRKFGDNVRIDAYHAGIGMAPGHLPGIFEAFQRLDSTAEDGLGLALFAVRRTIARLGHRIEIKSMPGRGARFSLFAPIARTH